MDEQPEEWNYLLLAGGDHCYDVAADLYHEDSSRRIVLIEPYPNRLVQIGVLPSFEATCRRELAARDVPTHAVELVPGEARGAWARARLLQRWMGDRSDVRLVVLCDRFASRYQRFVVDAVLGPADAARVAIRGLPDRRYDESNWWKRRRGVKEFVLGSIALTYLWCQGESQATFEQWNPDDYQRVVQRAVRETSS